MINSKDKLTPAEGDVAWAERVGCGDTVTGRIGLFTLLRLVASADGGNGYVCVHKGPESTLVSALHEADPKRTHWEIVDAGDFYRVWRRKEWNESYEKQKQDEAKKAVALVSESEFQAAKEAIMEFMLVMTDGNRRQAEMMFGTMSQNRGEMFKRGNALIKAREAREAKAKAKLD